MVFRAAAVRRYMTSPPGRGQAGMGHLAEDQRWLRYPDGFVFLHSARLCFFDPAWRDPSAQRARGSR